MVYLSICSAVGSVSIVAVKAFGIALKLTLAGDNQFTHPATYAFIVSICLSLPLKIFTQVFPMRLHGLRLPLDYSVNPLYYVTFTTSTFCSSPILFGALKTLVLSLICGVLLIFAGVYLLNMMSIDLDSHNTVTPDQPDTNGPDVTLNFQRSSTLWSPTALSQGASTTNHHGEAVDLMGDYGEDASSGGPGLAHEATLRSLV